MSSILRALRKLEQESLPEERGILVADSSDRKTQSGPQPVRFTKKNVLLYGVGVISLVMACVVLLAALEVGPFGDRVGPLGPDPNSIAADRQSPAPDRTTDETAPSRAVPPKPRTDTVAASRPPKPATSADRRNTDASSQSRRAAAPPPATSRRQATRSPDSKPKAASPRETGKSVTSSDAELAARVMRSREQKPPVTLKKVAKTQQNRVPPSDSTEFNPPTLASPELKLQAISWAEQPQQRIAVINGEILNIGEQISGYVVVNIRMNDVILQQNGTMWRMIFGAR